MNSLSVIVWCAIAKERLIEPYIFEDEKVNGENYRSMPIHCAFPCFASFRGDDIFHQYGAPPHYSTRVRTCLNNERPNNWIGRGGLVKWPLFCPDLTPYEFFVALDKRNGIKYSCYNHKRSGNSNLKGLQRNPTRCFDKSVR